MAEFLSSLRTAFWYGSTFTARLYLAIGAFCWGVLLALPGDTFSRSRVYDVMAGMASEHVWASAFMAYFVLLLSNCLFKTNVTVRLGTNLIGALLWVGATAAALVNFVPPPAAIAGDISLAVASLWVLFRTPSPRGF